MTDQADLRRLCSKVMEECACHGIRRSARALTRLYDHAFAPLHLKASQFPILVGLAAAGPVPLSPLAAVLGMDRTTLTRNLKPLEQRQLVRTEEGEDRRVRRLVLTSAGRKVLSQALELWQDAQSSVSEIFGADRLSTLLNELSELTGGVRGRA